MKPVGMLLVGMMLVGMMILVGGGRDIDPGKRMSSLAAWSCKEGSLFRWWSEVFWNTRWFDPGRVGPAAGVYYKMVQAWR